jgi:hypothetical protein
MSQAAAAAPRSSARAAALAAARVLLGLLGVSVVAGATYFSFFAGADEGGVANVGDGLLAAWAYANGIGLAAVAVLLGRGGTGIVRAAWALIGAYLVFSAIKIVGYGETEVVGMVVVSLIAAGLLRLGTRSR